MCCYDADTVLLLHNIVVFVVFMVNKQNNRNEVSLNISYWYDKTRRPVWHSNIPSTFNIQHVSVSKNIELCLLLLCWHFNFTDIHVYMMHHASCLHCGTDPCMVVTTDAAVKLCLTRTVTVPVTLTLWWTVCSNKAKVTAADVWKDTLAVLTALSTDRLTLSPTTPTSTCHFLSNNLCVYEICL